MVSYGVGEGGEIIVGGVSYGKPKPTDVEVTYGVGEQGLYVSGGGINKSTAELFGI